jgi:ABC-type nitrate/sulfonate/bicarbonate transport system substrate-binding protein
MLVAALTSNGMIASDVNFINMSLPDARTALLAGKIDGALQAAALIIRDQEAGCRALFTADGLITPLLLTAVRPVFAETWPDLLDIYLKVQKDAYDWILANTEEAVNIGAKIQQISSADGMNLYEWSNMDWRLTQNDIASMQSDVDFLFEQNMITQKIDPAGIVLPAAFGQ